jgi:hypothetical protein
VADRMARTCGYCRRSYWVEFQTQAGRMIEVGQCACTPRRLARRCQLCAKSIAHQALRTLYCLTCKHERRKKLRREAMSRSRKVDPERFRRAARKYRAKNREAGRQRSREYYDEFFRQERKPYPCKRCGKLIDTWARNRPDNCHECHVARGNRKNRTCDYGLIGYRAPERRINCVDCGIEVVWRIGGPKKRCADCRRLRKNRLQKEARHRRRDNVRDSQSTA